MKVTLTHYTENPLRAIEEAACNCYDSKPTKSGAIAKACIKSGHHSVTEFAQFTFHIEGVSRALTHQLVRHRMASYAQRSQRYVGENDFDYVVPPTIKNNTEAIEKYIRCMKEIRQRYEELQNLGIPNEDARMVLPNACCSTIEVSMNLRELMHFCNERLCTRAQWEIRTLAIAMKKEVVAVCPELADFLVPKCEINKDFPYCNEHNSCGRHNSLGEIKEVLGSLEEIKEVLDNKNPIMV